MTKLAIYRNNTAYEQFLAPALADRNDFEMQVFPQGTDPAEITAWLVEHSGLVRGMEKVYRDRTCLKAGKDIPSTQESAPQHWDIWMDVETNSHLGIDFDFQEAAKSVLMKATVKETIAEIIRHMLAKEVPDKVFLIEDHMGDHNLFGLGITSDDWKEEARRDAEILRQCLEAAIGKPVYYITLDAKYNIVTEVSVEDQDKVWLFYDRHCARTDIMTTVHMDFSQWSQFRVPIENLIEDATAFGIECDTESFSQAIREVVATW